MARCVFFVAGSRIEMHEEKLLCRVEGMRMILVTPTFFCLIFSGSFEKVEKKNFLFVPAKFNIFIFNVSNAGFISLSLCIFNSKL